MSVTMSALSSALLASLNEWKCCFVDTNAAHVFSLCTACVLLPFQGSVECFLRCIVIVLMCVPRDSSHLFVIPVPGTDTLT